MKIHERVREIRKSKGVTQTHVASKVGMTVQNYNLKENGKRVITAEELELIAGALNEPVALFFGEKINEKLNSETA